MIIVFDLDGTIIDSARDIAESIGEMLESYGAAPLPMAEIVTMVGEGAPILVRRALRQSELDPEPREALDRYMKIYDQRLMNHTAPYEGIVETLSVALRRGPMAILTNKPLGPSIGILEALGLRGFFSRVIGGDSEYGRKPDPAGLLALQSLAPGEQTVMIGDSPADWKTAEAASIPFVFARYGFGAGKFGSSPPATEFVVDHARDIDRALAAIAR
ncbi:MAG: HAD-IA family hydrolase [Acidobacteriota bacterium]